MTSCNVPSEKKTDMVPYKPVIPWTSEEAWAQVVFSISKTISAMESEAATIRTTSQQIVQAYADIETVLERVCLTSCPTCADVCCSRATVWYDLKDLLIIYLNTGAFPDQQIYRRPDHSCCNLTPSGCRLIRSGRPFICTWYICPDQNRVLEGLADSGKKTAVFRTINEIKTARKELEEAYINTICR